MPLGIPHSVFLTWDEDDQDKALAFQREKAKVCQECGTRLEEWHEDRDAYTPEAYRCPGCELLQMFRKSIPEDQKGVKTILTKRSAVEVGMEMDRMIQEAAAPELSSPYINDHTKWGGLM